MSETFEVGDVVKLKSGGPKMTVKGAGPNQSGDPTVWCVWFEGSKQLDGDFPAEAVERTK